MAGSFQNVTATPAQSGNAPSPWNNVTFSGSIAGTSFSGQATTSLPAQTGEHHLAASATGHIDGAFYGPTANEVGAVWTLSDGTGSAMGAFGLTVNIPGGGGSGGSGGVQVGIGASNIGGQVASDAVTLNLRHLDYTAFGTWAVGDATPGWVSRYQTPAAAVPTTGQATYSGHTYGVVDATVGRATAQTSLKGDASLNVAFAAGQVTGSLNDVSITATLSGATFAGTTAAASAPGGAYAAQSSATGGVQGALYGLAGQEAGAVWDLQDGHARCGLACGQAALERGDPSLDRSLLHALYNVSGRGESPVSKPASAPARPCVCARRAEWRPPPGGTGE